jgi:hypothetical protein
MLELSRKVRESRLVGGNWIIKWAVKQVKNVYPTKEKNSPRSAGRFRLLNTRPSNCPISVHQAK